MVVKRNTHKRIGFNVSRNHIKKEKYAIFIFIVFCMGLFSIPLFSNSATYMGDTGLVDDDGPLIGRNALFSDKTDAIFSVFESKIIDLEDWNSWFVGHLMKVLGRDNVLKGSCLLKLESFCQTLA